MGTTYEVIRTAPNGAQTCVAVSPLRDEALRIADAYTRQDRIIHTIRRAH